MMNLILCSFESRLLEFKWKIYILLEKFADFYIIDYYYTFKAALSKTGVLYESFIIFSSC